MAWLIVKVKSTKDLSFVEQITVYGKLRIIKQFNARFSGDKVLHVSDNQMFIIDGVLLNKLELFSQTKTETLEECIIRMKEQQNSIEICSRLRGPFSGCFYEFENDKLVAFGNQTGDTAVFYYNNDDYFIAGSDFNLVFDTCRRNCLNLTFDINAAYHIMSLGYVVEGHTVAKEIKRVKPGELVCLEHESIKEIVYHRFDNTNIKDITIENAIEQIDFGFKNAVKRCFDKDLEYGYNLHLVDLSGGWDSRMTTWVAHEMGYKCVTNICYAKENSLDRRFAASVAKELRNGFIFQPLDDLNFIYDIEELIRKNYGLATYNGITGGNRLLKSLNFNTFGLEHTGQLGDVIVSSFISSPTGKEVKRISDSDTMSFIFQDENYYRNSELTAMYHRGFQGALTSHFIRRNYTEVVSPFIDVDFMELCFSIPIEYRCSHRLYWLWIKKKYPAAARLPSTRGVTIRDSISWRTLARKLVGNKARYLLKYLNKSGLSRFVFPSDSMNPFDYWYHSETTMREFIMNYFNDSVDLLDDVPGIKQKLDELFDSELVVDKFAALTVLGMKKVYFPE